MRFPYCAATVKPARDKSGLQICRESRAGNQDQCVFVFILCLGAEFFNVSCMREFHQKHKHHIRLWVVLAIITAVSGYFAFIWKPAPTPSLRQPSAQLSSLSTSTLDAPKTNKSNEFVYTSVDKQRNSEARNDNASTANLIVETITVTLNVEDKNHPAEVVPGSTVYDLMKQLADTGQIQITFKDYGRTLGYLVEEINEIKNSLKNRKYWIYYINDKKAQIGISNYTLQSGDTITWKYEDETY